MKTSTKLRIATVSAAAMLATSPALAQDTTFTVSWWGFNGDALQEIIIDPFQEMCECEVVFETGNNADRLSRLQLRGGEGVDVIYLTDRFSQLGIELGLFQPIDRAQVPNLDNIYDLAQMPQGEYGPAYSIGRVGIVYNTDEVAEPITSWGDLWREDSGIANLVARYHHHCWADGCPASCGACRCQRLRRPGHSLRRGQRPGAERRDQLQHWVRDD